MNCQGKWIREAALGTLDASRLALFNAHLDTCAECRDAVEAERRLLAAIDQGIVARVQGTPSPEFAAGVRARLSCLGARASCPPFVASAERAGRPRSQAVRLRYWWRAPAWSRTLAVAALAALLLIVWFMGRKPHPRASERAHIAAPRAPTPQTPSREQMTRLIRPQAPARAARMRRVGSAPAHRVRQAHGVVSDQGAHLEVLVQPGQAAALAELYRTMQRGTDPVGLDDQSARAEDHSQAQPVEVHPMAIAQLQPLKPMEPASAVQAANQ
jgi:hypothetical protein